MSNSDLLKKVKDGIIRSGFPLEMKISKILWNNDWSNYVGRLYQDIETGKLRESDIISTKIINGIDIHLYIECKKSSEKQLVLYCPSKIIKKDPLTKLFVLKKYPKLTGHGDKSNRNSKIDRNVIDSLSNLKIFDSNIPYANSLLFFKGDQIIQDNIPFFSSINGMINHSILSGTDGYIETNFRDLYFYIVIWDGPMYLLKYSEEKEFDLEEVDYGQYIHNYKIKIANEIIEIYPDIRDVASAFGERFIIEIIKPNKFEDYILELENIISRIDKRLIEGWGEDWPIFEGLETILYKI